MIEDKRDIMGNFMLSQIVEKGPFRVAISFPRSRAGFHVMATSAGHEVADGPGYDWDGRRRGDTPFSIFQCTIAGAGNLRYERRTWQLKPGNAMLVTVPHDHRYWVEKNETWSFFWIAMSGKEILRLHRTLLKSVGPVFELQPETINDLAQICLSLDSPQLSASRASSAAYQATMVLYDELMNRSDTPLHDTGHEAIDRVTSHIGANLHEPLNIEALAATAGLSRAHFSRLFTRLHGLSPSEFVQRERMERAARLLIKGQLSIKAVATACGFEDPNYFAKVFRRAYSVSPSEFRTSGMYSALG